MAKRAGRLVGVRRQRTATTGRSPRWTGVRMTTCRDVIRWLPAAAAVRSLTARRHERP